MSMESPHEATKDLLKDLWKDKPLLITLVIGVIIVIYLVYKNSQASVIAPPAASGTTTPTGGTFYNTYSTHDVTRTGGTPSPHQPPAPPPPKKGGGQQTATIRAKQTSGIDAGWDRTHTGVPIRSQPSGYNDTIIGLVPFGGKIKVTGPLITGGLNQQGGSNQWYPVQGGYLSAWDVASIK